MRPGSFVRVAVIIAFGLLSLSSQAEESAKASAYDPYDWQVTGYVAWLSGDQLGDMLLWRSKMTSNRLYALALTRRLSTFYKDVDWEVEGQVAKHAGPEQYHWEFNALSNLRWNRFYWDKYVDTSAALGLGLSYATQTPPFEINDKGKSNRLLAYILVELAFSLPKYPQWAAVARIHHRSTAYETFEDDIQGASNAAGVGIKYRFGKSSK